MGQICANSGKTQEKTGKTQANFSKTQAKFPKTQAKFPKTQNYELKLIYPNSKKRTKK